ncbi:MAG: AAA family ATPase [Deltaproteobacteria bacterium]|nr:AAA family ATPase [Deltaproteobacteria bacterium]
MCIDHLNIKNFKCFDDCAFSFHPQFTLIAGVNGTGKTSLLDALSVMLGSWFLGFSGCDTRHIRPSEPRLMPQTVGDGVDALTHWEGIFPCSVRAAGVVNGERLSWERTLNNRNGRTTYSGAKKLKSCATAIAKEISNKHRDQPVMLPLIAYYGTGRLWDVPRDQARVRDLTQEQSGSKASRLDGYNSSIDPRLSVATLVRWIARQSWVHFQRGGEASALFLSVCDAMINCVEGATRLYFDADYGEVIIEIEGQGKQPFNNLSDGQRSMLAMVGDIAQKAATLNPHLGDQVLRETAGIVLIDELDLHLHPRWQRHIIEELRTTFPKIQFIATSHSPFLIQSLRSGEELLLLDGQPTAALGNLPLAEVAEGIMGVSGANYSARYAEMKTAAKHYLEQLEEASDSPDAKLAEFRERLAKDIAPYADNPAFQAFLEMKRAARLGE